jgi:hypothetical protein
MSYQLPAYTNFFKCLKLLTEKMTIHIEGAILSSKIYITKRLGSKTRRM